MAQSVSDRRKLDDAQALFDEVDMLRLESRERESVRAMLMLLGEMRFRTLALREAEAERALVDEIEVLGDKVQAYVERLPEGARAHLLASPRAALTIHKRPRQIACCSRTGNEPSCARRASSLASQRC